MTLVSGKRSVFASNDQRSTIPVTSTNWKYIKIFLNILHFIRWKPFGKRKGKNKKFEFSLFICSRTVSWCWLVHFRSKIYRHKNTVKIINIINYVNWLKMTTPKHTLTRARAHTQRGSIECAKRRRKREGEWLRVEWVLQMKWAHKQIGLCLERLS